MTTFKNWKKENKDRLLRKYRYYLTNMIEDDNFDLETLENWEEWTKEEYRLEK